MATLHRGNVHAIAIYRMHFPSENVLFIEKIHLAGSFPPASRAPDSIINIALFAARPWRRDAVEAALETLLSVDLRCGRITVYHPK